METKLKKWFRWQCRKFIFWAFSDRVKSFQASMLISDLEIAVSSREVGEVIKYKLKNMFIDELFDKGFVTIEETHDPRLKGRKYTLHLYCLK